MARLIAMVRRRTGTFVVVFVAVAAAALIYAAMQVPIYRATAEVVTGSDAPVGADAIRSRDLARRVALALRLDRDAAFLHPPGSAMRRSLGFGASSASASPIEQAVDRLVEGVSPERPDDTLSLLIRFTAPDAGAAAAIANEYARQFVERQPPGAEARLLSPADASAAPVTRGRLPSAAIGLGLALLAGVAAALLRERAFRGMTTGDEVERRTGLHMLGTVPLLTTPEAGVSPADAISAMPRSGFAEAFRSLRTATRIAAGADAQAVVVAVTAAAPGAGTSTIALCLARTAALAGDSVVLIVESGGAAADPVGPPASPLTGDADIDAALFRDAAGGLCVLRGREVDEALVAVLRRHFAWIVIDAPAGAEIAGSPKTVLVAVRWRSTPATATRQLAERLAAGGGSAFAVLTQVDMRRQVRYVHGDIANYYGKLSKYYS